MGDRIYLIVEYYIHNDITINFHVDDDVMEKKHALLSEGRPRTINPLR